MNKIKLLIIGARDASSLQLLQELMSNEAQQSNNILIIRSRDKLLSEIPDLLSFACEDLRLPTMIIAKPRRQLCRMDNCRIKPQIKSPSRGQIRRWPRNR